MKLLARAGAGRIANSATVASDAAIGGATQAAVSGDLADPLAKPIVRGIAVLPFDNLSPDPDNAFFAGGIFEEVLTKLSRMSELRIISRTSMESIAKRRPRSQRHRPPPGCAGMRAAYRHDCGRFLGTDCHCVCRA